MNELFSGERQVGTTLDRIRKDHRARYQWVADDLQADARVIDAGCGVGYGSTILAEAGATVTAFDHSELAINFAKEHYNHDDRISYAVGDLYEFGADADVVVAFEVLEHLAKPEIALRRFHASANRLYASVPNEDVFPYQGKIRHHHRHYTRPQFSDLLTANGWQPIEWWGQEGPDSEPEQDLDGRTLIAVCERVPLSTADLAELDDELELQKHMLRGKLPKSIAIVAMGTSSMTWYAKAVALGGRWQAADETWVINQLGGVLSHDRVFAMDDMAIQEARLAARESNSLVGLLQWMPHHPGPIYTSRKYDRYPGSQAYPMEWVLNRVGISPYFNSTVSYAIAFAIALGVEKIAVHGADYHYDSPKVIESGRGCCEFWLGVAEAKGIKVEVPDTTTLFDSRWGGRERFYGYDTEWLSVEHTDRFRVARVDRRPEDIPTASAIAARYSHSPNADR